MDLETITTTEDKPPPLTMLYMAVHPQQHANVREPKVVRHIHIAYSYQVTHLAVQSNKTLRSNRKPVHVNGQTQAFCGLVSQQKPYTIIQQCAKAGK